MVINSDGDTFETTCEMVDVTSLSRPDVGWHFQDAAGHSHQWATAGRPATTYRPDATYELPTLERIQTGSYYSDGEEYPLYEWHCPQCGERVEPGYTADQTRQVIPGLRHFRINGVSVSEEEFRRRVAARRSGSEH